MSPWLSGIALMPLWVLRGQYKLQQRELRHKGVWAEDMESGSTQSLQGRWIPASWHRPQQDLGVQNLSDGPTRVGRSTRAQENQSWKGRRREGQGQDCLGMEEGLGAFLRKKRKSEEQLPCLMG